MKPVETAEEASLRSKFGKVYARYRTDLLCTKCGITKNVEREFYKRMTDGGDHWHKPGDPIQPCKECTKQKAINRRKNRKGK